MLKRLQKDGKCVTIRPKSGRVVCPCGKTLLFFDDDTTIEALPVLCRKCGITWRVDLDMETLRLSL